MFFSTGINGLDAVGYTMDTGGNEWHAILAAVFRFSTYPQALLQLLLTKLILNDDEYGRIFHTAGGCYLSKKLYNVIYYLERRCLVSI